jgi:cytoskeletal protein CcmA (bactofilin family)
MNAIFDRSERENEYEDPMTGRDSSTQESTTINQGMRLVGEVDGTHDFYLNGELEGKMDISALIKIGRTGGFKGEMQGKNVIIEGHVDGKVTAEERVEIRDTGNFTGDIISPSVSISDKAYFQGSVTMTRDENEVAEPVKVIEDEQRPIAAEIEEAVLFDDDDDDDNETDDPEDK